MTYQKKKLSKPIVEYFLLSNIIWGSFYLGFPSGSDGKESTCNASDPFWSLVWDDHWRREWLPTPVIYTHIYDIQRYIKYPSILTRTQWRNWEAEQLNIGEFFAEDNNQTQIYRTSKHHPPHCNTSHIYDPKAGPRIWSSHTL